MVAHLFIEIMIKHIFRNSKKIKTASRASPPMVWVESHNFKKMNRKICERCKLRAFLLQVLIFREKLEEKDAQLRRLKQELQRKSGVEKVKTDSVSDKKISKDITVSGEAVKA